MLTKIKETRFFKPLFFCKRRLNKNFFLYFVPVILIFYILISLLDVRTIDLTYIAKYFLDSFNYLIIDRAFKEGYIFRLLSLIFNIILLFSFLYYPLGVIWRFFLNVFYHPSVKILKKIKFTTTDRNILLFLLIFIFLGLKMDLDYFNSTGSIDLRNRVVGARSFMRGYEPYLYIWKEGDPVELFDARLYNYRSAQTVSDTTITPTALLFHMFFANMQYQRIRVFWLILQYSSFLGMLTFLIAYLTRNGAQRFLISLLGALMSVTLAWRLHLERGQVYVMYALLSSIFVILTLKPKVDKSLFLSGLVLSFLIMLRPTFLVFLIPLMIFGKYKVFKYAVAGLVVLFSFTTLFLGKDIWPQYYKAVSLDRFSIVSPKVFDGMPDWKNEGVVHLDKAINIRMGDTSIKNILNQFLGIEISPESGRNAAIILNLFFIIILLWLKNKKCEMPVSYILMISYSVQIISDMLIAVVRYSYVDVMLIPILAIIVYESSSIWDFFITKNGWIPILGLLLGTSLVDMSSFINPKDAILTGQILTHLYIIGYSIWSVRKLHNATAKKSNDIARANHRL